MPVYPGALPGTRFTVGEVGLFVVGWGLFGLPCLGEGGVFDAAGFPGTDWNLRAKTSSENLGGVKYFHLLRVRERSGDTRRWPRYQWRFGWRSVLRNARATEELIRAQAKSLDRKRNRERVVGCACQRGFLVRISHKPLTQQSVSKNV